ncbi:YjfB family protein [Hydrogenophaga sp. RAC07]|uniref:YjfB family protein n=1 Tax=Hydrogenophaga sp. RAC07 TaxID=1842537 RepID=UPI00083D8E51|nr:YjfB family protein [Hydrogenophaga sp. RAC07]
MDVSPAAMVGAVVATQQASTAQEVQLAVMKKAMDMQGSGALSLLQSVTGNLPLATTGHVGTQLNLLA